MKKLAVLFALLLFSGCAQSVDLLKRTYEGKPDNKAFVTGRLLSNNQEFAYSTWGWRTPKLAVEKVSYECNKVAYDCTITSLNGKLYNKGDELPQQTTAQKKLMASLVSPEKASQPNYPEGMYVQARINITLQSEPKFSREVGEAMAGDVFQVIETGDSWVKVTTENYNNGWVAKDWITEYKTNSNCDSSTDQQYWIDNPERLKLQLALLCWDQNEKNNLEKEIFAMVKKIPTSAHEQNKKGYQALAILDRNNTLYEDKLKYYSMTDQERNRLIEERRLAKEREIKEKQEATKRKEVSKRNKIKRLYRSGEDSKYWYVVVAPSSPSSKVKCALYDANENVLVVDSQYVDPPLDKIIIRVPGGYADEVETVQCWGL